MNISPEQSKETKSSSASAFENLSAEQIDGLILALQTLKAGKSEHDESSVSQARVEPAVTEASQLPKVESEPLAFVSENQDQSLSQKEDVFTHGRERVARFGEKVKNVTESVTSRVSNVGKRIGNFFRKSVEFGKALPEKVAIGIASAPELFEAGMQKADQAAIALETGITQGVSFAGTKIVEGAMYIDGRVAKAEEWIGAKAEVMKNFAQEKVELAGAIAEYAKDRTKEKLVKVQEGIFARYMNLKNFMQSATAFASAEMKRTVEDFRSEVENIRIKNLETKIARGEIAQDRLQKIKDLRSLRQSQNTLILT